MGRSGYMKRQYFFPLPIKDNPVKCACDYSYFQLQFIKPVYCQFESFPYFFFIILSTFRHSLIICNQAHGSVKGPTRQQGEYCITRSLMSSRPGKQVHVLIYCHMSVGWVSSKFTPGYSYAESLFWACQLASLQLLNQWGVSILPDLTNGLARFG